MRTLSVSLIVVVLSATIGLGWLFDTVYLAYQQDQYSQSDDTSMVLERVAANLAASLAKLDNKDAFIAQWQGDYSLQLSHLDELALPVPLKNTLMSGEPLTLESSDLLTIHVKLPQSDELLLLNFQSQKSAGANADQRFWFTALFYILLISAFLIWLTPLLQRLLSLRKIANEFGRGHFEKRIQVGSISYIKDVELEFNRMAQRIEDLVGDVKLLSSAVSHDLRTPLAKLRMGLDTLSEETNPERRTQYHQRLDAQLDTMVELVETLLQYARMDQAMIELQKCPVNLNQLLAQCVSQQDALIDLSTECIEQACLLDGDSRYLKIAINNLIENACKYAESRVSVSLEKQKDDLILIIEDDGCGVPEAQREQVFKPFVRANNHTKQGFGVGLAMVKRVLDWHNATIQVTTSTTLGGAQFQVRFKPE